MKVKTKLRKQDEKIVDKALEDLGSKKRESWQLTLQEIYALRRIFGDNYHCIIYKGV